MSDLFAKFEDSAVYNFFMLNGEPNYTRIIWCAVILFFILKFITVYNRLLRMRNNVQQTFAALDTKLTQRNNQVTNLSASCKKYMEHESETFARISELRSQLAKSNIAPDRKIELQSEMSQLSRGLMMQVESYPALRADSHVSLLMRSINELEEQISAARRSFNAAATDYNNKLQSFPTCLYALALNFKTRKLYEATADERKNPDVNSLFNR